MHPKNDHYEVLGLQRGATKKQIILAFNEKSEEFENDQEKYYAISLAFRCLNDEAMKK